MTTHPFIPLYVDDYDAATAHLTAEEDGIYGRLLRLCWRTPGCNLPSDHSWIAKRIMVSSDDFERLGTPILAEFFTLIRGRYVQRRLKREYDDISRKKLLRQQAGKKGGITKSMNIKEKNPSNATILLEDTRASPEPYPEPKRKENAIAFLSSAPPNDVRMAFLEWNELAGRLSLPVARELTEARRQRLKARLADGGLERWREALRAVEASRFCRGQKTEFRADLDFVLQAKSFQRLIEGSYGSDAQSGEFDDPSRFRPLESTSTADLPIDELKALIARQAEEMQRTAQ